MRGLEMRWLVTLFGFAHLQRFVQWWARQSLGFVRGWPLVARPP